MQDISDIGAIETLPDDVCAAELATKRSAVPPRMPQSHEDEIEDFSTNLLRALATMAVRSKRRQADLSAVICRGGLSADRETIAAALRRLEKAGLIENIVPLYDGGMLISVTSRGIEQLNTIPRWAQIGELAGMG